MDLRVFIASVLVFCVCVCSPGANLVALAQTISSPTVPGLNNSSILPDDERETSAPPKAQNAQTQNTASQNHVLAEKRARSSHLLAEQRASRRARSQNANSRALLRGGLDPEHERASSPPGPAPAPSIRPAQRAEEELDPFAPLGVRVGSFLFLPQITSDLVYSDNVFSSSGTNKKSDWALVLRPRLVLQSDWRRHDLRAELDATRSFYKQHSDLDEKNLSATVSGRADITRRTALLGGIDYSQDQEDINSLERDSNASERSTSHTLTGRGGVRHRFNRFEVQLRGSVSDISYEETPLTNGGTDDNADRDYRAYEGQLRLSYDFKPGLAIFGEAMLRHRDFATAVDDSGFNRDANAHGLRGGIRVDFGPKLNGEVSLGGMQQNADDARLSDVSGVVVDANLRWRPSALTTVNFTAKSDIEATTIANAAGLFSRSFGVNLRHELLRYFIISAAIDYDINDYDGLNLTEEELTLSIGTEFILSRSAALTARYQFTDFDSTTAGRAYQENELRLGMRLRR